MNDNDINDLLKAFDNPHHCFPQHLVDAIRLLVKERDNARRDVLAHIAELKAKINILTAERDEARRLLKAVVDMMHDNMVPDATHPKHLCDFIHRPDIAMCKVCEDWTDAMVMCYPDDFQDEEETK